MKSRIFFSLLFVSVSYSQASECDGLFEQLTKLSVKSSTYKDSAREPDYRPQVNPASYKGHLGYVWMDEKKDRAAVSFTEDTYKVLDQIETDKITVLPIGTKLIFSRLELIQDKDWCGPNTCTCVHEGGKKDGTSVWNCTLDHGMVK